MATHTASHPASCYCCSIVTNLKATQSPIVKYTHFKRQELLQNKAKGFGCNFLKNEQPGILNRAVFKVLRQLLRSKASLCV